MKITFKLYASLTQYLPVQVQRDNRIELDVAEAATIAEVVQPFGLPTALVHLVLVNGVYIAPEARLTHALKEGDTLAIWPPIAGG